MEDHDLASARERMLAHADDPITGVCRYCARMLCPDYVRARTSMAEAGLLGPAAGTSPARDPGRVRAGMELVTAMADVPHGIAARPAGGSATAVSDLTYVPTPGEQLRPGVEIYAQTGWGRPVRVQVCSIQPRELWAWDPVAGRLVRIDIVAESRATRRP